MKRLRSIERKLGAVVSQKRNARRKRLRMETLELRQLLAADTGLTGTVFDDVNLNGMQDADESVAANIAVYIDQNDNGALDGSEPSTLTDSLGAYEFTDLDPGDYVVRQVLPAGVDQTSPVNEEAILFALDQSTTINQILRLDPMDGSLISAMPSPVSLTATNVGLAFDGNSIFAVDAISKTVYEIDSETGSLLDSDFIGKTVDGAAALNGKLYLSNPFNNKIFEFDPVTDAITNEFTTTANIVGGLAAITGPDQLVATVANNQVVFINPTTGVVEDSFFHGGETDLGAAVVGQRLHLSYAGPLFFGSVIFDRTGGFVASYNTNNGVSDTTVRALAGNLVTNDSHAVTLTAGQTVVDLDFGRFDSRGDFGGTIFVDRNGDGVQGPDDDPKAGVTVYLDLNDNGVLDASEPAELTDVDGEYRFGDQAPGNYVVREVEPERFSQTSPFVENDVLFALRHGANPDEIFQLDSQDGSVIRRFNSGYNSTSFRSGMAFDGRSLFVVDANGDVLVELDPDTGAEIRRMTLPDGGYDGLAVLNGLLYISDQAADDILVFDPASESIITTLDVAALNGGLNIVGGLAAIRNPDALVVTTSAREVVFIDPITGVIQSQFAHGGGSDQGVAVLGDEVLLSYTSAFTGVVVYERDGTIKRSFLTSVQHFALAGSVVEDNAYRISLSALGTVSGLDFGNLPLNQVPVPDAGGPYEIVEGDSITLNASATTDGENDPLTYHWDLDGDGEFDDAIGVSPTVNAGELALLGLGDDGMFDVAVLVDDGFDQVTASSVIAVANVDPAITAFQLSSGAADRFDAGEMVSVLLEFDDPGTLDEHSLIVDWGDGVVEIVLPTGDRAATLQHVYSSGGQFDVAVTLVDEDGGNDSTGLSVLSVGARVVGGTLQIVGSNEDDYVRVNHRGGQHHSNDDSGTVRVSGNLLPSSYHGTEFQGVSQIHAWLGDGDDWISVSRRVDATAILDGEGGNDVIWAGGGTSVLLGGVGNDWLFGGGHRNVMIGGTGSDRLFGGGDEDILIGGTTSHDRRDDALLDILNQWNSDDGYETRIEDLETGDSRLVRDETVFDDGDVDILLGGRDKDWFFGENQDRIWSKHNEIVS